MNPALFDTHQAIVGASGAGKTVTAKGVVEALLDARRHVCVIDPTGAWWGLRSAADGAAPGFDIPIFGGVHGDVPITADQGEAVGAIIAGGVSAVVDISGLRTGAEQRRFMRDLLRRLRAKPDGNFHLVVDEADEFAAQKPRDDYGFQVGEELVWMAKRGRLAGFVLTLITQRPASIDKEVLTQAQTLIVHQLVAPVDQKPILDYLRDHADRATLAGIRGSLAGLRRGERWLYSPRAGVLECDFSPMPRTFDSSRTPEPGETRTEPKLLASIDLAEIRKALAGQPLNDLPATDNSGESLKPGGEISRLKDQLLERDEQLVDILERNRAHNVARDKLVAALETRALAAEDMLSNLLIAIRNFEESLRATMEMWGMVDACRFAVDQHLVANGWERPTEPRANAGDEALGAGLKSSSVEPASRPAAGRSAAATSELMNVTAGETAPKPAKPRAPHAAPSGLNKTALEAAALLRGIAPDAERWDDVLLVLGRRPNSGDSRAARKGLADAGLIFSNGPLVEASAKLCAASDIPFGSWPAPESLIDLWADKLRGPGGEILTSIARNGPGTSAEIAARLGKSATSGWWRQGLKDLRRSNLIYDQAGALHLHRYLQPGD